MATTPYLITFGTLQLRNPNKVDLGVRPILAAAYLCSAKGRLVGRDELSQLLWPDATPKKARHSLSQALHGLRATCPELEIDGDDALSLNGTCAWDYDEVICALKAGNVLQALRVTNGPFLRDAYIDGGNAFEEWRDILNARLYDEFEKAFTEFAELDFVRTGGRQLQRVTSLAQERLGIELLSPNLPEHISLAVSNSKKTVQNQFSYANDAIPLVGRDNHIKRIVGAYHQARQGNPKHIVLLGDSGIGKTRLATAAVNTFERFGALTLKARCFESDQSSGFGPLLNAIAAREEGRSVAACLSDPWHTTLKQLLSRGHNSDTRNSDERQHFVHEALSRLLERMAEDQPVILFIDDVHWASAATIGLLKGIIKGQRGGRLLLLMTSRIGPLFPSRLSLPENDIKLDSIYLEVLSRTDVNLVARAMVGEDVPAAVGEELYSTTAGHPYLLSEAVRTITAQPDFEWSVAAIRKASRDSAAEYLQTQLHLLSPGARMMLNTIAVYGKPAPFNLVRRVAGATEVSFLNALQELIDHGVLYDDEGFLETKHDLVRESVRRSLSPTQRRLLHRRIAMVLRRGGASSGDLVVHYLNASMRNDAYISSLRAARLSERSGADAEMHEYLSFASRTTSSPAKKLVLKWRRANYAFDKNSFSTAKSLYQDILNTSPQLSGPRECCLRSRLLDIAFLTGDMSTDVLVAQLTKFARETRHPKTIEYHVNALTNVARIRTFQDDRPEMRQTLQHLLAIVEEFPTQHATVNARRWASLLLVQLGDRVEARRQLLLANAEAEKIHDFAEVVQVLNSTFWLLSVEGQLCEAMELSKKALGLAERHGLFRARLNILGNMSTVAMDLGRFNEAENCLLDVLKTIASNENLADSSIIYANYALLKLEQGQFEEAADLARRALDVGEKFGHGLISVYAHAVLGQVALEHGSLSKAKQHRTAILNLEGSYMNDDILAIEQFLSRLSELEGRRPEAITRVRAKIDSRTLSMPATCRYGLMLELARLLAKESPSESLRVAQEVAAWAQGRGARFLEEQSENLTLRLQHENGGAQVVAEPPFPS